MERDPIHRRSLYLPGCLMSPTCLPVREEIEYSRIHCCSGNKNRSTSRRTRRWRNFIRRLVKDGKSSIYGSKPLSFHYDAVSYSQNFDEGCYHEEPLRCPKVFRDVRWDLQD